MQIVFYPPIGQALHLRTSVDQLVNLRFIAHLSRVDYEKLTQECTSLQLWSDAPIDASRRGSWNSFDFRLGCTFNPLENDARLLVISTDPPSPSEDMVQLSVCFPVSTSSQTQFCYTFRLVHPGKKITWLGAYGENGVIILDPNPQLHLAKGWVQRDGEYIWTGRSAEVARISSPNEYVVWAFGNDSFGRSTNPNLVYLVPENRRQYGICAHTFVFSSASGTIHISSTGIITYTGSQRLKFNASHSHAQIMDRASEYITSSVRLLSCDERAACITLASPAGTYPVNVAVIPLHPTFSKMRPILDINTIKPLLPNEVNGVAIFPPAVLDAEFCSFISESHRQYICSGLKAPGLQFLVAPVHEFLTHRGRALIAILSTYDSTRFPTRPLPTPPPSPPWHSQRHPQLDSELGNEKFRQSSNALQDREDMRAAKEITIIKRDMPRQRWWIVLAKLAFAIFWAILIIIYRRIVHQPTRSKTGHTESKRPRQESYGVGDVVNSSEGSNSVKETIIADVNTIGRWGAFLIQQSGPLDKVIVKQDGAVLNESIREIGNSISLVEFKGQHDGWIQIISTSHHA